MNEPKVHLEQPWNGFSCLHIGDYRIGIAVTDENGEQDPGEAGRALVSLIDEVHELRGRIRALETALKPFADSVFNDNGDITVAPPSSSTPYKFAYWAMRKTTQKSGETDGN